MAVFGMRDTFICLTMLFKRQHSMASYIQQCVVFLHADVNNELC